MINEFCSKVWPNGEFGLTCARKLEISPPEVPLRTDRQKEDAEWILNALKVHGAEAVFQYLGLDPLEFTTLPNSHKPPRRGRLGITPHGRRLVRNAAYRLESETPINRLSFATFTLPNITRRESLAIARNWAEIVRVFLQKLKRLLVSRGLPGEIVGVTEIQEKRTQRDGILALHLHLVFVGRLPKKTWGVGADEFRVAWRSVLHRYLFNAPESYEWRACENITRVKYSAEQYLGKYMSKGCEALGRVAAEFGEEFLPTSWYSCSNSLRSRVLKAVRTLTYTSAKKLIDCCVDKESVKFIYRRPIELCLEDGRRITIGWYGKIKREYLSEFTGDKERNVAGTVDCNNRSEFGIVSVD